MIYNNVIMIRVKYLNFFFNFQLSQVKVQPNTLFGCPNNNTSIDIGPLQKTVQCLNDNRTQVKQFYFL